VLLAKLGENREGEAAASELKSKIFKQVIG
jgi:hypothetical protein